MITTWFTSDHHFGHANILKYESTARSFSSLKEMNEALIHSWNAVVRPDDIVYHLGDFAFGRKNIAFAAQLNGKKRLIMGNHDIYPVSNYLPYFERIRGVQFWHECILTHVPVHPGQLEKRSLLNVHGHLHSKQISAHLNGKCYFNVSVEQNNLIPIHEDAIMERLKELQQLMT